MANARSLKGVELKITSTRARLLASTIVYGAAALALSSAGQAVAQPAAPVSGASADAAMAPTPGANGAVPSQSASPVGPQAPASLPSQGGAAATSQPINNSGNAATTVQEVVVTGSRIPQPNLTSTSPLTVVNDQEIRFQGTTQVETLLNNLPSVTADQNEATDNGSAGVANVSLRGLGPNRTLVLVDGKRLMPGDPAINGGNVIAADLNNIPSAVVDHVEVLTGGASSVYGSDAVAGVVNFIMKKNFSGVRIDAQTGFSDHTNNNGRADDAIAAFNTNHSVPVTYDKNPGIDARTYEATVLLGVNAPDDKGNITAYASYRNLQPLTQNKRDFGACGISTLLGGTQPMNTDRQVCQGSNASPAFGHFSTAGGVFADDPGGTNTFVPYTGALAFNFGPYNYYQREDDRYSAGYFAHYKVDEKLDIYSDFMFANDSTVGAAAPSGLFSSNGLVYTPSCDNPLASASQLAALCGAAAGTAAAPLTAIGYRFAGVPRLTTLTHEAYRIDVGAKGDLGHGWTYDAYLQYGHTVADENFTGDASITKLNNALNVAPDGTCVNDTGNCTPLNIFTANSSSISPAALKYVLVNALKTGELTEQIADASITGDLGTYGIKSPFASDGVGVSAGTEYRREQLSLTVDNEFASGDLSGNGGVNPPANGAFDVYEIFGEIRAPLLEDRPFAKSLDLEGGYRFSTYSTAGVTNTYKVALNWQPINDLRFRGGYNRAVRAPNIAEEFQPQIIQLASFGDPCSGANPTATLAACERTGVTAAQYGRVPDCGAAQCSIETGGNTNLTPEKSDTYTGGLVFTPTFVRNFNVSIDYFYIIVRNAIQQGLGGTVILNDCETSGNLCNLIHRDEANGGSLTGLTAAQGYIVNTNLNSGFLKTSGVDFTMNYRFRFNDLPYLNLPNLGSIVLNYVGTYTGELKFEPGSGLGVYNCAGLFGTTCGEPTPTYRHEARATWATPFNGLSLSLNWRYVGPVALDLNQNNPLISGQTAGLPHDYADGRIPSFNYFDLAASIRYKDRITFRAGINNLFDKDPPVLDANNIGVAGTSGFGNGNTFPGVYDTLGRSFFFGATADF